MDTTAIFSEIQHRVIESLAPTHSSGDEAIAHRVDVDAQHFVDVPLLSGKDSNTCAVVQAP